LYDYLSRSSAPADGVSHVSTETALAVLTDACVRARTADPHLVLVAASVAANSESNETRLIIPSCPIQLSSLASRLLRQAFQTDMPLQGQAEEYEYAVVPVIDRKSGEVIGTVFGAVLATSTSSPTSALSTSATTTTSTVTLTTPLGSKSHTTTTTSSPGLGEAVLSRVQTILSSIVAPLIHVVYYDLLAASEQRQTMSLLGEERRELHVRFRQSESLADLGRLAIVAMDKVVFMRQILSSFASAFVTDDSRSSTLANQAHPPTPYLPFLIAGHDVCFLDTQSPSVMSTADKQSHGFGASASPGSGSSRKLAHEMLGGIVHGILVPRQVRHLIQFAAVNLPEMDRVYSLPGSSCMNFLEGLDLLSAGNVGVDGYGQMKVVRLSKRSGRQLFLGVCYFPDRRDIDEPEFSTFMVSVAEISVNALDRMFVERRLLQSEQQMRYIWRSVKEAMVAFQMKDGIIVESNEVFEELFQIHELTFHSDNNATVASLDGPESFKQGISVSVMYRRIAEFSHLISSDSSSLSDFLNIVVQFEKSDGCFQLLNRQDVSLSITHSFTFDPVSETDICVLVIRDVSERRRRQDAEMKALRSQAENTMKSKLIHSLSHEIRNPLQAILSMSQLLQDDKRLNQEQLESVQFISSIADYLLLLVADILDHARIETGAFKLEKQPFDLYTVAEECVQMLVPQTRVKFLDLTFSYDSVFPYYVVGDSRRTKQIILNLLSNAVKFVNPHGHVHLEVKIRTRSDGANKNADDANVVDAEIHVMDDGIGMDPGDIGKLWTPFSQLTGAQGIVQQHTGSGLGLSISSSLVSSMSGTCEAYSGGRNQGSRFSVSLPFAVDTTRWNKCAQLVRDLDNSGRFSRASELCIVSTNAWMRDSVTSVFRMQPNARAAGSSVWFGSSLEELCEHLHETSSTQDDMVEVSIFLDDNAVVSSKGESPKLVSCDPSSLPRKRTNFIVECTVWAYNGVDEEHTAVLAKIVDALNVVLLHPLNITSIRRLKKPVEPLQLLRAFVPELLFPPSAAPEAAVLRLPGVKRLSLEGVPGGVNVSVLLVEDDATVRTVLGRVLTKSGFSVEVACNGEEAVAAVVDRHRQSQGLQSAVASTGNGAEASRPADQLPKPMFDVVLMDVIMPRMDGIQACKELRKLGFTDLPIIGCTASFHPHEALQPEEASGDSDKDVSSSSSSSSVLSADGGLSAFLKKTSFSDCLSKPVRKQVLLETIMKWVLKRRSDVNLLASSPGPAV
jgi:signal transduction histidine kinase/CheY-like chemotaxis protein